MKTYQLLLTLQEDTIFSARSATIGAHESLSYVPGATLYGACAASIYAKLPVDDQFTIFHSGKVRFGNGLPQGLDGKTTYPMPFSWHVPKGALGRRSLLSNILNGAELTNRSVDNSNVQSQLKQLRGGFVNKYGEVINPKTSFSMKTAIEGSEHTAAESQLFGYSAVRAGSKFVATLSFDEDISRGTTGDLVDTVCNSLSGRLRLGRSKSAQYGTVICELAEVPNPNTEAVDVSDGLRLWLISDVAIRDKLGQPSFQPSAESFGLDMPDMKIDWARTFIRTRRYSPYNAKRRTHDQERHVLEQGSVIAFKPLGTSLSVDAVTKLHRGVGDYLHSGLGQILVQSDLLAHVQPQFSPLPLQIDSPDKAVKPKSQLIDWLDEVISRSTDEQQLQGIVAKHLLNLKKLYQSSFHYSLANDGDIPGPGKSQWGHVLSLTKSLSGAEFIAGIEHLLGISKSAPNSELKKDADWSTETGLKEENASFAVWLLKICGTGQPEELKTVRYLATLALDLHDDLILQGLVVVAEEQA